MRRKLFFITVSIFLLLSVMMIRVFIYYPVACKTYAESGIKKTISTNINAKLIEYTDSTHIEYNHLVNISKDRDENITSISVDTLQLNSLAMKLANLIYLSIDEAQNNFGIPLGNAFGIEYLSGKGPLINITVLPIGTIDYEIKSDFSSAGINQTLHRITIEFITNVNCIAPFEKNSSTIKNEIIIAETLIVGKIPNYILQR